MILILVERSDHRFHLVLIQELLQIVHLEGHEILQQLFGHKQLSVELHIEWQFHELFDLDDEITVDFMLQLDLVQVYSVDQKFILDVSNDLWDGSLTAVGSILNLDAIVRKSLDK
jgi:hypothetical protein